MASVSLQELLGLPKAVKLSARTWVAATVLGLLRTEVNNEHRRAVRDRGPLKNLLNDLQGSLGELVGMQLLYRSEFSQTAFGLLDLKGSVDQPDLVIGTSPLTALDVKCHFDETGKHLFLVNEKARIRSARRGVAAFLPVVTAAWRRNAYIGRPIPAERLKEWTLGTLGAFYDPARKLPLEVLDNQFLGNRQICWGEDVMEQWGASMVPESGLHNLVQLVNKSTLVQLRRRNFSLDGLSSLEVRQSLLDLVPSDLLSELLKADKQ